jgi:hypothetical protein
MGENERPPTNLLGLFKFMELKNIVLVLPDRSVDVVMLPFIPRTGEYILQPGRKLRVLNVTYDTASKKSDTSVHLDVEEVELT